MIAGGQDDDRDILSGGAPGDRLLQTVAVRQREINSINQTRRVKFIFRASVSRRTQHKLKPASSNARHSALPNCESSSTAVCSRYFR